MKEEKFTRIICESCKLCKYYNSSKIHHEPGLVFCTKGNCWVYNSTQPCMGFEKKEKEDAVNAMYCEKCNTFIPMQLGENSLKCKQCGTEMELYSITVDKYRG